MKERRFPKRGPGFSRLAFGLVHLTLILAALEWVAPRVAPAAPAAGQDDLEQGRGDGAGPYRTPLAGEAGEVDFNGRRVTIPGWDRRHMNSITLGGSLLEPQQGDSFGVPVGALFLRHFWQDARTRSMISLFVNELEYARIVGNFELIGHFENYTLPVDQTEIVGNEEIEPTSVRWGTLTAALGPGLRIPVAPYQADNDLRLQLLGRAGYLYAQRSHDTGPAVTVPPNTVLYGTRLRARYDALRRNLLELPHSGFATGFDLDYLHRDKWHSLEPSGTGSIHRNYFQAKGHFLAAGGLPGLSERDRFLVSVHGGTTNGASADRYNAFVINGGPFPSEQEDLARVHYSGLLYQDVRATSYATTSLGYRRELSFFLYLSTVGSLLWADRATVVEGDRVVFRDQTAAAATVSLDSAFFWNSSFYLAYVWESGFIRGGEDGSGVILIWNKLF